ncbi:MAG: hypothetical protein ACI9VR_000243 [Cognaticolwellia sp.]|jgi:hypothetical protein
MTTLSNLFAWIWLLFPGSGPAARDGQQIQPCSTPVEDVCEDAQQRTEQRKHRSISHFWQTANPNGISNGI